MWPALFRVNLDTSVLRMFNGVTMKQRYLIRKVFLISLACCLTLCVMAGSRPFFTTAMVLTDKGQLLLSQKGLNRVDLFSADGSKLVRSYPLDDEPTGLTVGGNKA